MYCYRKGVLLPKRCIVTEKVYCFRKVIKNIVFEIFNLCVKPSRELETDLTTVPVISKVFEKLMQPQIFAYVEKVLSPFRGYRKGYSPQHALLTMLEKWKVPLDKGGYGGGVLMELSKAFDTLDHDLLTAKLHAYGFGRSASRFIKSYLSDRWKRVKINNSYRSWSALLKGVPQGSVLDPLLFNIYLYQLHILYN